MRNIMILFLALLVALAVLAAPPQGTSTSGKAAASQQAPKEDRLSGTIVRSSPDKSALTVKEHKSNIEHTVFYNATTKWTKEKGPADMKEFKDGSRVVCLGKFNEKGELTATRIDLQKK